MSASVTPSEGELAPESLRSPSGPEWERLLPRALAGEGVSVAFQPIVDLRRRSVVGYESLARFVGPSGLTPDRWFAAAAERGRTADLEAVVLRQALAHRRQLPSNCFLTVNMEPDALIAPPTEAILAAEGSLRGLVLEITEHRPIVDPVATMQVIARLRERGALIALDDAGAGYAGLQQILLLRPSFLKVDRGLVDGVDRDEAKVALLEMLGLFASRIDAWLLAEGVETEGESQRLFDLGVPLAQGYFYGRPAAPWSPLNPSWVENFEAPASLPRPGALYGLIEACPWVYQADLAAAAQGPATRREGVVVVLGADRCPVGVWPRGQPEAPLVAPMIANVNTTPQELAQRLATRSRIDSAIPVVVTDNAGRYVGVVTLGRLLVALAGSRPA